MFATRRCWPAEEDRISSMAASGMSVIKQIWIKIEHPLLRRQGSCFMAVYVTTSSWKKGRETIEDRVTSLHIEIKAGTKICLCMPKLKQKFS